MRRWRWWGEGGCTGPADYVLFVDRLAVGVIEAKRDEAGEHLTDTEAQTARYAHAALKWRRGGAPLTFLFEATGQIIRFTDGRDPLGVDNVSECGENTRASRVGDTRRGHNAGGDGMKTAAGQVSA